MLCGFLVGFNLDDFSLGCVQLEGSRDCYPACFAKFVLTLDDVLDARVFRVGVVVEDVVLADGLVGQGASPTCFSPCVGFFGVPFLEPHVNIVSH